MACGNVFTSLRFLPALAVLLLACGMLCAQSPVPLALPPVGPQALPRVAPEPLPGTALAARLAVRDYQPWWNDAVQRPLRPAPYFLSIEPSSLLIDTLRHSARIQAISDQAVIAETGIQRAVGEFDWVGFLESKLTTTSVPTGSTLEAGFNVPRLREQDWFYSGGMRQKNAYGGQFEAAQKIGLHDSNSNFFFPSNQGNSRLTLSYTHPLMNGSGQAYNANLIVLATIDTQVAVDRTVTDLQEHLLDVTEGLWEVYLARCLMLQKRKHLQEAESILERLEPRRAFDTSESQIARARAAVALRQSELIRLEANVRNAETRLRTLVNSPHMLDNRASELIPVVVPARQPIPIQMSDAITAALENRPEIDVALREVEAARVRLNVAKNELLPVLDLVFETYVSGLRGRYDLSASWFDQFTTGEPSYVAGFVFERPVQNRSAKANVTRRHAEIRQLSSQLRLAMESLYGEVEIAVREVETTQREMESRCQSLVAAEMDYAALQRRWELLPGDDRSSSFLLEDLLLAQDRVTTEEAAYTQAQVAYTLSMVRLNRVTGLMLRHQQIDVSHGFDGDAPTVHFWKQP